MSLHQIYTSLPPGSPEFCAAVAERCTYGVTVAEIGRIAAQAPTPEDFEAIWCDEMWWTDPVAAAKPITYTVEHFYSGVLARSVTAESAALTLLTADGQRFEIRRGGDGVSMLWIGTEELYPTLIKSALPNAEDAAQAIYQAVLAQPALYFEGWVWQDGTRRARPVALKDQL